MGVECPQAEGSRALSTAGRHERLQELFRAARILGPDEREAFLRTACADDPALRVEVEELLAHDLRAREAFASVAGGQAARLLLRELEASGVSGLEASPQPIPATIGDFDVLGVIGEGGMGIVYEAMQRDPPRRVAIKVIRPGGMTPELLRRFRQEARVLAQLEHPGIARIYATGTADRGQGGQPYFAMELVKGRRLLDYAEGEHLGTRARLELVARICDALHHAHQRGVVHRDLKPANIVVTEGAERSGPEPSRSEPRQAPTVLGQPMILDFGVARALDADIQTVTLHTGVGQLVGTVPYMSPEQASGDSTRIDARSDVYSVGVLTFELLTGRLPHDVRGKAIHEAVGVIREQEPSRLSALDRALRGDVETIVAKAIEKEPGRRYASAAELAADIRRYLRDEPIQARPASSTYQLRKFARRNKALVGGIAATLVVSLAGAVVAGHYAVIASQRADEVARKEKVARRQSYVAVLAAAEAALRDGDYEGARKYLDGAPAEHRGWEWRHLVSRLHQHVAEWETDGPIVQSPVLDAAGGRMYAVLAGNRIGAWELASGTFLGSHVPAVAAPAEILLNGASGRYCAVSGAGELVLGDLATGAVVEQPGLPAGALHLGAWHPSGDRLALTLDGSLRILERGSLRELGPGLSCRTFLGERERFASAYRSVLLYDEGTGALLARRELDDEASVLKSSDDGSALVFGGIYRNLFRLDPDTLDIVQRYLGHFAEIVDVAFPSDGGLASTSRDGTLRLWDDEGRTTTVYNAGSRNAFCTTLPDGRVLALGERVLEFDSHGRSSRVLRGHEGFVYNLVFSPDGSRIASTAWKEDVVNVWDPDQARLVASYPAAATGEQHGSDLFAVPAVAFSRDGRRLVTGTTRETRNRDLVKGEELPVPAAADSIERFLAAVGHAGGVRLTASAVKSPDGLAWASAAPREDGDRFHAYAFSCDGLRFAACHSERVEIHDVATGRNLGTLQGPPGKVYCAEFSPDGTRIATGGNDATVRIWDASTYEQLVVLRGHEQYVKALAWSPDGRRLVSASGDTTLRIWDSVDP